MTESESASKQRLFDEIHSELAWARVTWRTYHQLFGSAERRDVLQRAASGFAWIVARALANDLMMRLGRLLDPPKSLGQDNLCLERLVAACEAEYPSASNGLRKALYDVRTIAAPLKGARNKRLAHNDLPLRIGEGPPPMMLPTRSEIDEILRQLEDLANSIAALAGRPPIPYDRIEQMGDADQLMRQLLKAEAYRHHVTSGRIDPRRDHLTFANDAV